MFVQDILEPGILEAYELIDSGYGKKIERFGKYITDRPESSALWKLTQNKINADLEFNSTKNEWIKRNFNIPDDWLFKWQDFNFIIRPGNFKHVGIFPEQANQWIELYQMVKEQKKPIKVLNLFGYTGVASVVCKKAGADVTHIDSSKNALSILEENIIASNLPQNSIRIIREDCLKFTEREVKRGNTYDFIIADPPSFGHGTAKEYWKFNKHFPELLSNLYKLLSPYSLGLLINAYNIDYPASTIFNMFKEYFPENQLTYGELGIRQKDGKVLTTGIYCKWRNKVD